MFSSSSSGQHEPLKCDTLKPFFQTVLYLYLCVCVVDTRVRRARHGPPLAGVDPTPCVCVHQNGSTLLLWICRFNYDSTGVPPCFFTTKSPPPLSLHSRIIRSPLSPDCGGVSSSFFSPSSRRAQAESGGDQMKKSHLASPAKVSQSYNM